MENEEKRFYEDLKYSEKMRLRREFNGILKRPVILLIIYFIAFIAMVLGSILFFIYILSPKRQYWQLAGFNMANIAMFALFSIMQTFTSKEKGFLNALGSKNQVIRFFVTLIISLIGNAFLIVYIFAKMKIQWLYWLLLTITCASTMVFLLPYAFSKDKEKLQKENDEESFFLWLEKEKNIIRKI